MQRYNINPYECSSINELIFMIDEVLEDESDADDLDGISREISEFNYYANTNKWLKNCLFFDIIIVWKIIK